MARLHSSAWWDAARSSGGARFAEWADVLELFAADAAPVADFDPNVPIAGLTEVRRRKLLRTAARTLFRSLCGIRSAFEERTILSSEVKQSREYFEGVVRTSRVRQDDLAERMLLTNRQGAIARAEHAVLRLHERQWRFCCLQFEASTMMIGDDKRRRRARSSTARGHQRAYKTEHKTGAARPTPRTAPRARASRPAAPLNSYRERDPSPDRVARLNEFFQSRQLRRTTRHEGQWSWEGKEVLEHHDLTACWEQFGAQDRGPRAAFGDYIGLVLLSEAFYNSEQGRVFLTHRTR